MKKNEQAQPQPDAPPPPGLTDLGWRQAALYAGAVEHYDDAVLYDYEYRRRRHDIGWYRALARQLRGRAPLRILELGCGSGRLLVPLLRDGHAVLGIDRSAAMLRRCAERMATLGQAARQRGQLLRADFRSLPLADAPTGPAPAAMPASVPASMTDVQAGFPLIVCPFNGFMHLYTRRDVEECLAQVRRLLAPGGRFVLDVLNPDPAWLARDPLRRWSRTRFRHPLTGEPLIYTTNHIYDAAAQVAWIRIYYEPDLERPAPSRSPAHTVQLTHRQFYPAELEALFHYCGFTLEQHLGGFDGQPISSVSAEQVICARVR